ncbi:uncharacterized protein BO87DRAFT_401725 [Aspergillus neoniger CBS 115656]|uniref:Uncharacterized protein n=1 Tax=Aspergillus neoniger (strain CBS 115656) TaxID=1448310 RepID=A0A318Y699_ASPNB|nr:hypothetical protein BO87DRAFT_401725 [Aspergillus neoniger CBS 115656]PYH29047.1 hypothetical protein BO87DRAFT_401725 [Aspergillus neoniger CBS 115656]
MRSFPHVRSPWRIRHNYHAVEPRVQLLPYIRWLRDDRQGGYIRGGTLATCWVELEQSIRPDPSEEDGSYGIPDGRYHSAIRARSSLNVRPDKTWQLYDHSRLCFSGWLAGGSGLTRHPSPSLPQCNETAGSTNYYYYRNSEPNCKSSSNPNRRTANSGRNVRAIVFFGRSGHSSAGQGSCLIRESSSSSNPRRRRSSSSSSSPSSSPSNFRREGGLLLTPRSAHLSATNTRPLPGLASPRPTLNKPPSLLPGAERTKPPPPNLPLAMSGEFCILLDSSTPSHR